MISKVIENGYCVGCGACAAVSAGAYQIQLNQLGAFQAFKTGSSLSSEASAEVEKVCPFSDSSANEDQLSKQFLPQATKPHARIGGYLDCYVGRVSDPVLYGKSSSGGVGRWILSELLNAGDVTAVIQVVESFGKDPSELLYKYSVCTTQEEVQSAGKSAYYPVELSGVVKYILEHPGKYAITGVPCFVKAIRGIARINSVFADRVKFTVGIVCGHLKSSFYAEMIGWQLGVHPDHLTGLDFRVKIPGKKANEKGVSARSSANGGTNTPPKIVQEIFGTNYGHGYFKYQACDYCDDVLAETADISIGDAWLPEFMSKGTSIAVVRNPRINELVQTGITQKRLKIDSIAADRVADSQDAGLRHRREGLSYRLFLKSKDNQWAPKKRVEPGDQHLTPRFRKIHRLRMKLSSESFRYFLEAKKMNNWSHFESNMRVFNNQYVHAYEGFVKSTVAYKVTRRLFRYFKSIWRNTFGA